MKDELRYKLKIKRNISRAFGGKLRTKIFYITFVGVRRVSNLFYL